MSEERPLANYSFKSKQTEEVNFSNLLALISELHVDIDYFRERKGTEKPQTLTEGLESL